MKTYTVNVGNIGNIEESTRKAAEATFREYCQQSKDGYGRAAGESVTLLVNGEPVKEYVPAIQTPTIAALASALTDAKRHIDNDMTREGDTCPSMDVTLACGVNGYALQLGDNSFTGSAYSFPHWGVSTLYRRSNARELARDLIDQCRELVAS